MDESSPRASKPSGAESNESDGTLCGRSARFYSRGEIRNGKISGPPWPQILLGRGSQAGWKEPPNRTLKELIKRNVFVVDSRDREFRGAETLRVEED